MSLTAGAGWDLISPRTAPTARTKPSEHDTKHIKNVKDQTCALYTTSLSVYLSNHLLYRTLSLSTSMPLAAFFASLSLSLYGTSFLLLCSRVVGLWYLPLFKEGEDAVNAKHKEEGGESSCGIVSRFYRKGVCDITCEREGSDSQCCFKHLSILSLSICFLLLCSRTVKGTEGGSRTRRDGAYLSVLRLLQGRALRRSMRSVQSPDCSQGTPIPSLLLSSVSMGVVLLASG